MVGIQIGKEQEERKREEEGLNFETTPWWNFRNHHGLCGRRAAEREFVKFVKLRAQPTAKAKNDIIEGPSMICLPCDDPQRAERTREDAAQVKRELTPSFHQF